LFAPRLNSWSGRHLDRDPYLTPSQSSNRVENGWPFRWLAWNEKKASVAASLLWEQNSHDYFLGGAMASLTALAMYIFHCGNFCGKRDRNIRSETMPEYLHSFQERLLYCDHVEVRRFAF
jgi:hypothetical protein